MAPSVPNGAIMPWEVIGQVIASATSAAISCWPIRLAYKADDSGRPGTIVFVRAGTHVDLFE